MPIHSPEVTLYVPCRDAEDHIRQTLESVLGQTYPLSQVVVVDDGSTDGTSRLVREFPVDLVRHPEPMGISATRNTAVHRASGEVVASVDADVVLEENWLEEVMKGFAQPQVGGVGGRIIEKNTEPVVGQWLMAHRNPDRGGESGSDVSCLAGGAVAYRRTALLEIGGYHDDKRYDHSDLDLSLRVKMIGYRLTYEAKAVCYHHFRGDVRRLFDGLWNFRKDAYIHCGLFTNLFGLRRKIRINLGEFYQTLMDDFDTARHSILYLNIIGALRHSLMDIRLYFQLHPRGGTGAATDGFEAIKLALVHLFRQKKEVSRALGGSILKDVLDICMDSEREGDNFVPTEDDLEGELLLLISKRFPRADLDCVSDWLVLLLGFLNSFPEEIWSTMNRSAVENPQG